MIGLKARLDEVQKQQEPMILMIKQFRQNNDTLNSLMKLSQDHANYVGLLKSLHHEKTLLMKQETQLIGDLSVNCKKMPW